MEAMPCWPRTLSCPLANGYSFTPQNTFRRTQMDSGAARQRRTSMRHAKIVNVSWLFEQEQLSVFESFFMHELYGGAAWFLSPLGNGHGVCCVKARFNNPSQPYSVESLAGVLLWKVTATLESFDMPIYTKEAAEIVKDITASDIDRLKNYLENR